MMRQITLTKDGVSRTYQKPVNMRMSRTAYETRTAYYKSVNGGAIGDRHIKMLLSWLVEAYDGQFTEDDVLDGYSGSFLEIISMIDEIITSVSDALVAFPKQATPAEA